MTRTDERERVVLVINSGSSSLKYQLIEPDSGTSLADGKVQRIGEQSSSARLTFGDRHLNRDDRVDDHDAALRLAFDLLQQAGIDLTADGLTAVGHRIVHGGNVFYRPTLIDDGVIARLKELSSLAPLHNPPAVQGVEVARQDAARRSAHCGVRHGVLSRPTRRGGYLRNRSGAGREVAHPPVRVSRHVTPIRQRTSGGLFG